MTAISEFRKLAAERYPATPIEFEDGVTINLKSPIDLNDVETTLFNARVRELTALDDDADVELSEIRQLFVDLLADIADNPDLARERFVKESMSVLTAIFETVAKSAGDASKSAGDSKRTSRR
jgi:hypothetical protein